LYNGFNTSPGLEIPGSAPIARVCFLSFALLSACSASLW
jgi:hypothetical protein